MGENLPLFAMIFEQSFHIIVLITLLVVCLLLATIGGVFSSILRGLSSTATATVNAPTPALDNSDLGSTKTGPPEWASAISSSRSSYQAISGPDPEPPHPRCLDSLFQDMDFGVIANYLGLDLDTEPGFQRSDISRLTSTKPLKISRRASSGSTQSSAACSSTTTLVVDPIPKCSDFTVLDCLGDGGSAKVCKVRCNATKQYFALKVAAKSEEMNNLRFMIAELESLKLVNGSRWAVGVEGAWEDEFNYYLLMPLITGGNLDQELASGRKFSEFKSKLVFSELSFALEFIHSQGIIHRDVKLENILKTAGGHYMLTDFGLAHKFDKAPTEHERTFQPDAVWSKNKKLCALVTPWDFILTEVCGTLTYISPEMLKGRKYGFWIDHWSLAVVLFYMLTGRFPWYSRDDEELKRQVLREPIRFNSEDEVSDEGIAFVKIMLEKNPEKRMRIKDMYEEPFLLGLPWSDITDGTLKIPDGTIPVKIPADSTKGRLVLRDEDKRNQSEQENDVDWDASVEQPTSTLETATTMEKTKLEFAYCSVDLAANLE